MTFTMEEMNNYLISKYNKIILKYERYNNSEIISLERF